MNLTELEKLLRKHAEISKSAIAAPFDIESEELYMLKKSHIVHALALVAAIICIIGTTAFAAYTLLSPQEIAKQAGYDNLSEIIKKDGIPYDIPPQQSGNYSIEILGITSGKNLSNFIDVDEYRSYIIGSISRIDGQKLYDYKGFQMSPLISGYEPWKINIFTLNGGKSEFINDDDTAVYFVYECDSIEIFADKTVYIAFYEGLALSSDIFKFNADGSIQFNESYNGIKALFEIPLDKSKANPEKAKEYIDNLENPSVDKNDNPKQESSDKDLTIVF